VEDPPTPGGGGFAPRDDGGRWQHYQGRLWRRRRRHFVLRLPEVEGDAFLGLASRRHHHHHHGGDADAVATRQQRRRRGRSHCSSSSSSCTLATSGETTNGRGKAGEDKRRLNHHGGNKASKSQRARVFAAWMLDTFGVDALLLKPRRGPPPPPKTDTNGTTAATTNTNAARINGGCCVLDVARGGFSCWWNSPVLGQISYMVMDPLVKGNRHHSRNDKTDGQPRQQVAAATAAVPLLPPSDRWRCPRGRRSGSAGLAGRRPITRP